MVRSPRSLARLLLLASTVSLPRPSLSDEPRAAAGAARGGARGRAPPPPPPAPPPRAAAGAAAAQARASGAAAPRADAEVAAPAQEPGAAAAPSLSPRLTPAPAAPPATPSPGAEQKEKAVGPGAAAPAGPVLTVAEISDDAVRLAGPNVGLVPRQVGRVIARDGATVGRIVIVRVLENGAEGLVVSGNVAWGARVRFEAPAKR